MTASSFARVLDFAAFGQATARLFRNEPGGIAHRFIGPAQLVDFHQEGFDHKFLHAARLPEHAFGVDVKMKVARLDGAESAGFFRCFALCGLAMREARLGRSFGEGPLVSAVGVHQQKLNNRVRLRKQTAATCSGSDFETRGEPMGRPPALIVDARHCSSVNVQQKLCR